MRSVALRNTTWFKRLMRFKGAGAAALAIGLVALAGVLTVRSAPDDVIPKIVVLDPPPGLALPLNSPITFIFNTAMDHASTQAALTITTIGAKQATTPLTGDFTWPDDNTLQFTPATPLKRSTDYVFTFKSGAKSAAGQPLQGDDSFRSQTVGDLQVAQVIPADQSKDVAGDALITVIFNRPVVPLVSAEQQGTLPNPIAISPAVQGTGTWINTSIYQFKPNPPLKGGVRYQVTVKGGLTDQSGSTLPNNVLVTFSTIAPQLTAINLGEYQALDKQTAVIRDPSPTITFSQPMDHAATESSFNVSANNGQSVSGKFSWAADNLSFTFKPDKLLDYSGHYVAKIDPNVALSSTGSTLSTANPATQLAAAFTVVDKPHLIGTNPANGDTTDKTNLMLSFSGPMTFKDFMSHVTVTPKPGSIDGVGEDGDSTFNINLGTDGAKYTVTIDPTGITDIYGTPLLVDKGSKVYTVLPNGKLQIKYEIVLNFPPEFSLQTAQSNNIGLYSAYAPETRVYSKHRNVTQLNLSLWQIPDAGLLSGLNGTRTGFNEAAYTPGPENLLRTWQLAVENPAQALRYDLLAISANGPSLPRNSGFSCAQAPPTRLAVGQTVIVLKDDPSPLNVRADHSTKGNVIARLPVGSTLKISNGPLCAEGYVWWQIAAKDPAQNNKTISGWVAEGDKTHYFIGADPALPIAPNAVPAGGTAGSGKEPLKPGAYFLSITTDATDASAPLQHVMIVGTANIVLKMGETSTTAWVTDLKTGLPAPNLAVKFALVNRPNFKNDPVEQPLETITTDVNGLATVQYPRLGDMYSAAVIALINDGKHYAIGSSNFSNGIDPYNFNLSADYAPAPSAVYLYSDRSLYKPGQPVYIKGVVRSKDDIHYGLIDRKTIPIEVFDDKNQSIYQEDVPVSAAGTFSASFTLDANASLGYYQVVATLEVPNPDVYGSGQQFSRAFSVAEYRPPEFQVNLTADKPEVVQGDKVKVTVDSSFFFGGAVSNAAVSWTLLNDNSYFNYTGQGSYSFFDYNEDAGPSGSSPTSNFGNQLAQGSGKTDAQGKFVIEVPADLGKSLQSQVYTLEAQVTDLSGQPVTGRTQVIVHAGLIYLGATPEQYVGTANQPSKIDLLSVDWHSQPAPNTTIDVQTVERQWHSVQQIDPSSGQASWQYDVKEAPVDSAKVTTDADGKAVYSFTPPHAGEYKVYLTSHDSRGNKITSATFVYIAGSDYVPWRETNDYSFTLKADKQNYHVGDTASLLIASPFQGAATALVTVERGGILKTEVVPLTTNSTVYKLPVDASYAPNVFVSVLVVKGVDDKTPVPLFRIGMTQLNVDTDQLKLTIAIKPDKAQAGPRETVNYALHVTDYAGKAVSAEVGVGLTDLAVLSLLPDTSTPILDYFYNQQSLGVITASTLTLNVDEQTQTILNKVKGGGGGGPEGGIFEVRQLFVDTPLWKPSVLTDANGDAMVSVQLPDQLTTWRLDARAITLPSSTDPVMRVGQTTFDLISTKPLLIRPLTPRFYVQGDQGTLAAVVNNNTGADQQVTVKIAVEGAKLSTADTQTVSIANGTQARVEWPITVLNVNKVGVTFYANSADNKFKDAAKSAVGQGADKTLPVYTYTAPETVGTAGTINTAGGSVTEGIVLPKAFDASQGSLDLSFAPSLAAALTDALSDIGNQGLYKRCTESTVSAFLPNIVTDQALTALKIPNEQLHSTLKIETDSDLQTLYSQVHVDGGWGVCVEYASDATTTAYALLGLVTAKQNGYSIDQKVIDDAVKYLKLQIKSPNNLSDAWQLNQQAFVLYVLAKAGAGTVSDSVNLFNVRVKLDTYARAYLALDFHLLNDGAHVLPLISDLQNSAITSATGQHWQESYIDYWNWNTDTRTTAIALDALVEIQPDNALIPNVVRWLMVVRKSRVWETTQETVWSILALSNWMQHTGELNANYSFKAALNGRSIVGDTAITPDMVRSTIANSVPVGDLQPTGVNKLLITRTGGNGLLYYTAHLTSYLAADKVKALDRGITLSRKYSLARDPSGAPITQAHVGDDVRVTLTIVAASELHFVRLTDPVPAGAEAIDPQLATSGSVGTQPSLNPTNPFYNGWGWWWFGDTQFYDQATVLSAEFLPAGTYEYTYILRTGLAGAYKVIPATISEQYFPEVYGRSDGALMTLLAATSAANDPTQTTPTPIVVSTLVPTPAR